MYSTTELNEAFYKFINNEAGRVFWPGNANPYLKYMANSKRTEVCTVHYRSSIIKFISYQVVF